MNCPGCSGRMTEEDYEGVKLGFCSKCGGVWSTAERFGRVAVTQEMQFSSDQVLLALEDRWKKSQPHRKLTCPDCKSLLEELDHLALGVFLDRCPKEHGVFFDHLELEKIQILVERSMLGGDRKPGAPVGGPRECPHCGIELTAVKYEGVNIDECGSCGGHWLDTGELNVILDRREKEVTSRQKASADAISERPAEQLASPHILCPICKDVMNKHTYAHDTDFVIDRCAHGIWLDKGEIDNVQAYIEGSEDLAQADRVKWGSVLDKVKEAVVERRAESIEKMKWSRFGFVNKFLRKIADKVMD